MVAERSDYPLVCFAARRPPSGARPSIGIINVYFVLSLPPLAAVQQLVNYAVDS